jgi:hypothetical protein
LQEPAYVPCSNRKSKTLQEGDELTNQQHRKVPKEVISKSKDFPSILVELEKHRFWWNREKSAKSNGLEP